MAKKEKKPAGKKTSSKAKSPKVIETELPDPSESLMPELEELVKKNPNRLIGCGG
ncbi:MAG: hypothetical protein JWN78_1789 [Bacteroidota bacterium]|nr:hypothetical protein [Bacteroidota bacterium]